MRSKGHQLRCAVIVNDMAALNIDAELVKQHHLIQQEEKIVQLQNGCICCTLREDLLVEVANLAEKHEFDYLVIESTGISEPVQVAETFTPDYLETLKDLDESMLDEISQPLAKLAKSGGIANLARLDTCVTMVNYYRLDGIYINHLIT